MRIMVKPLSGGVTAKVAAKQTDEVSGDAFTPAPLSPVLARLPQSRSTEQLTIVQRFCSSQ